LEEGRLFSHVFANCSRESQEQIARAMIQAKRDDGTLSFINMLGNECLQNDFGAVPRMES
jgi:hypothetical protein